MSALREAVYWIVVVAASAPIWGTLLWDLWEGIIQPRHIPRDRIDALAALMLTRYGDRAEEMAWIEEDRAWRYFEYFKQGMWRRVRKRIAEIRRDNIPLRLDQLSLLLHRYRNQQRRMSKPPGHERSRPHTRSSS
jgi:hypothetical protein